MGGSPASAGADPTATCTEAKAKATGKETAALLKAFGKNIKKPSPAQLAASISKAQSKMTKAFVKAESKGGCTTTGDVAGMEAKTDAFVWTTVGGCDVGSCGDGISASGCGEECDEGIGTNGTPASCCNFECTLKPASTACTDADGNACTLAGCDGADGACDQNHVDAPASTPCADTDGNVGTTAGCDGVGGCDQAHVLAPANSP